MNKGILKRLLSGLICLVLIAVAAMTFTACDKETPETPSSSEGSSQADESTVGERQAVFDFKVTDKEGNATAFKVKTDKTVVGEALEELGIIEGEEGQFGLYVKKVNGIVADFDIDGTYWAFYIDGQYAVSGIDKTEIEQGKIYELRVEK